MSGGREDFKLLPVHGASLLNGLGMGVSDPLLTMTKDNRLGVNMTDPKSVLHVGGGASFDGGVHADGYITSMRGIRIAPMARAEGPVGPVVPVGPVGKSLAERVDALEAAFAALKQRS
jgi:hypothetical protein